MTTEKKRDRWADWLVEGRQRGLSEKQVKLQDRFIGRIRDRVLKEAHIRKGSTVLDVGAGTGLLALEARRRVGPRGLVVASDVSHDALLECRRSSGQDGGPLVYATGDVLRLPFRNESFDRLFTRSVLIYLADKQQGIHELYRALKPKGVASIFEPINEVARRWSEMNWEQDLSSLEPAHSRVQKYIDDNDLRTSPLLGFDERHLVNWFVEAGFSRVSLKYEHTYESSTPMKRITTEHKAQIAGMLRMRPNPLRPSYEEIARAALGDDAADYLVGYARIFLEEPRRGEWAAAYLTARK